MQSSGVGIHEAQVKETVMKTSTKNQGGIKTTTGIKAGGLGVNHSRKLLAVKSGIKAGDGILQANHCRHLA